MDVMIVGAHGQIAQLLAARLIERGDVVRGVVRKRDHADELEIHGVQPVLVDIESAAADDQLTEAARGADAIVFAAGAGPGSGTERKWTVDYRGAVHTATAAARAGVPRIVVISAMGTDAPPEDDSVFSVYLRAKSQADEHVRSSGLAATIVRPGRLTNEPPTGRVRVARHVPRGQIPRADVAAVVLAVLADDSTIGCTFEVISGSEPVEQAIARLADT